MPFVTEFNENRILKDLYSSLDESIVDSDVYNRPLPFLNRLELSKLKYYKNFLEGDIEISHVYNVAETIDRLKYVHEGNRPSYHRLADCEFLHSNFRNVELPEEVQNWEEDEIQEFRRWFKKNIKDETNDNEIVEKIIQEWGITCNVQRVDYKNSGNVYQENLDIDNVERRIDSLLQAQRTYYFDNQNIISKHTKRTYLAFREARIDDNDTGLSDDEFKEKLKEYHNLFKVPIVYYIKEYLKLKYSKDINFEEKLLESLNFKKCRSCYNENHVYTVNESGSIVEVDTLLDHFLSARNAKEVIYRPKDLRSYICEANEEFREFYYYCKVMAKIRTIDINGTLYIQYLIEYIFKDKIHYKIANFAQKVGEEQNELSLFEAYLVHTKFEIKNSKNIWREIYNFNIGTPTSKYKDKNSPNNAPPPTG